MDEPAPKKLLDASEADRIASAILDHGFFIVARCQKCLVVKRPFVDASKDDGKPCRNCEWWRTE